MAPGSRTFSTYLSTLRRNGWVIGDRPITITDDGIAALGDYEPLPEGQALVEHWLDWCGHGAQRRMLEQIVAAGEDGITKEDLGVAADVAATGGSFQTYLSTLRTACLVEKGDRRNPIIKAAPTLLGA